MGLEDGSALRVLSAFAEDLIWFLHPICFTTTCIIPVRRIQNPLMTSVESWDIHETHMSHQRINTNEITLIVTKIKEVHVLPVL